MPFAKDHSRTMGSGLKVMRLQMACQRFKRFNSFYAGLFCWCLPRISYPLTLLYYNWPEDHFELRNSWYICFEYFIYKTYPFWGFTFWHWLESKGKIFCISSLLKLNNVPYALVIILFSHFKYQYGLFGEDKKDAFGGDFPWVNFSLIKQRILFMPCSLNFFFSQQYHLFQTSQMKGKKSLFQRLLWALP